MEHKTQKQEIKEIKQDVALIDNKLNFLLKAIKEVGFPIVLSCVLVYFAYSFGNRLLDSHDKFIGKISEEIEKQTENTSKILVNQEKQTITEERQTIALERQVDLFERRVKQAEQEAVQAVKTAEKVAEKAKEAFDNK